MKAANCTQCRNRIHAEEREAFLKNQYAILKDAAFTFACYATTAALAVQVRRGRSKEYIQKMFEDMVAIFDTETFFGKQITLTDIMEDLTRDYGIDFNRINVHLESEKEFVKGVKKN